MAQQAGKILPLLGEFLRYSELLIAPYPGFPGGADGKESACTAGDPGSIPGLGRFPGGGHAKPTPELLPGEFHGQRSLTGYSPWGHTELDMTEATKQQHHLQFD